MRVACQIQDADVLISRGDAVPNGRCHQTECASAAVFVRGTVRSCESTERNARLGV